MKASKIASLFEQDVPLNLKESWDNCGFQLGNKKKKVKKILTTLDITPEVIDEALTNQVDMILSHHPFFFNKINHIDPLTTKGKMIEDLIKNDIVVYSAHTNLDKAAEGLNVFLGKELGLKNITPLVPDPVNQQFYKLVVYAPEELYETLLELIDKAEAGQTSPNYSTCTFSTQGQGSFKAKEGADPYIGDIDEIEKVKEIKFETVVKKNQIRPLLESIKRKHPYEEIAYDLFELEFPDLSVTEGLGIIGCYPQPISSEDFIDKVKKVLGKETLRTGGKQPKTIKKVALCTGAGAEFITLAKRKGADVYITGDLKYHDFQRAKEENLWVIDAGHFATEQFAPKIIKEILENKLADEDIQIEIAQNLVDYITEI